jgi:SAM-dependent methyltransferase
LKIRLHHALDSGSGVEELARITKTDPKSLYRVMRAMANIGILRENDSSNFETTPIGKILLNPFGNAIAIVTRYLIEIIGSLDFIKLLTRLEAYRKAWNALDYSIRTGNSAFTYVNGTDIYQYIENDIKAARIFDSAMSALSAYESSAILSAYDFSGVHTLLDVGGGLGILTAELLKVNPYLAAVILESPSTTRRAAEFIRSLGLDSRCKLKEGNFFECLPRGFDVYLFKHVIHNWNDNRSIAILRNCNNAMNELSRILIIEMVIPPGSQGFYGKLMDLEMLVFSPNGLERNLSEYHSLLVHSNLKISRIIQTKSSLSIIEAVRSS